jgi:RHS repeat-associated protein
MAEPGSVSSDVPARVAQALYASSRREGWDSNAAVVYIHHDHLKSTTGLTDESGLNLYSAVLYPHGLARYQTSEPVVPYSFTGKERDESTGLQYFGSRFFESRLAQWTSPDILHQRWRWPSAQTHAGQSATNDAFEAVNRYQYVSGNPIAKTDPDGNKYQFDPGCSADFKRQFRIAIKYLNKHQASGVIAAVEKRPEVVIVREGTAAMGNHRAEYSSDGTNRTLTIDFHSALLTSSGGKQSPALLFVHESAHALHDMKNYGQWLVDINTPTLTPQDMNYDNVEERKTIKGAEKRAARRLGEDIRTDHRGTFYNVSRANRR